MSDLDFLYWRPNLKSMKSIKRLRDFKADFRLRYFSMTDAFQSCSFLVMASPFQSNWTLNLPKLTWLKTADLKVVQESWSSNNYLCRSHRACGQLATCLPVPSSQWKDAYVNIPFLKTKQNFVNLFSLAKYKLVLPRHKMNQIALNYLGFICVCKWDI